MPYLLSLGAYLLLLWIFGLSELVTPSSVFVPHDTFYPISDVIWTTSFGVFNSAFNYSNNLAALMVLIPDAIIIGALQFLFSNNICQIIHIALCLIIFHSLSFASINRIFQNSKLSALLTLCYCLSPYSSILYSAGIIYQISTVVALGILPLFLFKLMTFEPRNAVQLIPLTTLLAFGLLFIYPALLLILLTLFIIWRQEKIVGLHKTYTQLLNPKSILIAASLSLPFIFFIYLTISIGSDKGALLAGGTSTAIKGGMFYPLMQISAWGLYDIWSPRAILSFHNYFFENPYRILSIALATFLIYFLYKNKKYTAIFFVLFLAFFAKGPNAPFGELFNFIINYLPFGYMIRSPDSKFGAFIAAWFVVAIYYLHPKQKTIVISIATLFLLSNLSGIFANGAISSNKGDAHTSTFIQDSEANLLVKLIESHSNAVVVGNFSSCAGEWYEDKFHTCHGLISTSTNRQFIPSDDRSFSSNIALYKDFPTLIFLDKRQRDEKLNGTPYRIPGDFEEIYKSKNYSLLLRSPSYIKCKGSFSYSCIKKDGSILVSLPESAFRYFYPATAYAIKGGILQLTEEPPLITHTKQIVFIWLYVGNYIFCLLLFFFGSMSTTRAKRNMPYSLKPTKSGIDDFAK